MHELAEFFFDSPKSPFMIYYLVLCLGMILGAVVIYVLQGLALTSLCRASRRGSVWMAWVPFVSLYLLGLMADVYTEERVLRGEVEPRYYPSFLRRRTLCFSIGAKLFDAITGAALFICFFSGLSGFMEGLLGGFFENEEAIENAEKMLGIFKVSLVIFLVLGAAAILFSILYLLSACKAFHRLFLMLKAPVPVLWAISLIFIPALPIVMLFVFTRKSRETLTEKFYPPIQEADEPAEADGELPSPAEPPAPEPYQP